MNDINFEGDTVFKKQMQKEKEEEKTSSQEFSSMLDAQINEARGLTQEDMIMKIQDSVSGFTS